ncbi:hypothetical protein OIU80_14590 [Flavobacterium sp. LS1R47]|uniref:Uncharacterized protein n=1 Tax=Flavobacterium frigoritolerans TaxID=2987686 RepID=A0A9X2ZRJ0_9FLAO|nr:hypothetical protein [Flavobacterium frigoritolerans]MCV9933512.1 hypothetical protein [Flavobacterium frigoritolerans]
MSLLISLFGIVLLVLFYSCNPREKPAKEKQSIYRAVNANKDTAVLSIVINKTRFYGQYEIKYGETTKDSGSVKGNIKGNIFIGEYYCRPYGGNLKRVPISLLRKDNKLFLGNGVTTTYLGFPCFAPGVPITYADAEFVFEEIKK